MDTPTKVFDPLVAPLGEVLDWLRKQDGWHTEEVNGWMLWCKDGYCSRWDEPDMDIDRIAGMLPEVWKWEIDQYHDYWRAVLENAKEERSEVRASTELEARARVVAAVLMREGK